MEQIHPIMPVTRDAPAKYPIRVVDLLTPAKWPARTMRSGHLDGWKTEIGHVIMLVKTRTSIIIPSNSWPTAYGS